MRGGTQEVYLVRLDSGSYVSYLFSASYGGTLFSTLNGENLKSTDIHKGGRVQLFTSVKAAREAARSEFSHIVADGRPVEIVPLSSMSARDKEYLAKYGQVMQEALFKGGHQVRGYVTRLWRKGEWYYYCINVHGNCGFFSVAAMTDDNASWTRRKYGLALCQRADSETLDTAHWRNPGAKDVVALSTIPSLCGVPVRVYDRDDDVAGGSGNRVLSPAEAVAWFDTHDAHDEP